MPTILRIRSTKYATFATVACKGQAAQARDARSAGCSRASAANKPERNGLHSLGPRACPLEVRTPRLKERPPP